MSDINEILKSKLKSNYPVKSLNLEVKDVDTEGRKVVFYASAFNTLDHDNDVIVPGAFTKSIQEIGPASNGNRKIAHLRNHDFEHQIGKPLEMQEDSFGLKVVSQLSRSSKGEDALKDYQDGILREHSIGFNYVQDKLKFIEESSFNTEGHWQVGEVKLWEVSGVTFGSNQFTPVLDVSKGLDKNALIETLNQKRVAFENAIKSGKGTDERLQNLEAMFKQICELQEALLTQKQSVKDTLKDEKAASPNSNTNQFFNHLLNNL